ncbi:MAG: hypothetical protein IPL28_05040 [Chloroflexi bacterium]|nr:hypothetical protein [Chloroflexota bacterium]
MIITLVYLAMRPFPLPNPYPNLLANVSTTAADVAQRVAGYPLTFLPIKDQQVEWGVAWPSFVYTFYSHLDPIPTQAEFGRITWPIMRSFSSNGR